MDTNRPEVNTAPKNVLGNSFTPRESDLNYAISITLDPKK